MACTLLYTGMAGCELRKMPPEAARTIIESLSGLKTEPYSHVKKLGGTSRHPLYSHRVGRYRAILAIEDDRPLVLVLEAGHRSRKLQDALILPRLTR